MALESALSDFLSTGWTTVLAPFLLAGLGRLIGVERSARVRAERRDIEQVIGLLEKLETLRQTSPDVAEAVADARSRIIADLQIQTARFEERLKKNIEREYVLIPPPHGIWSFLAVGGFLILAITEMALVLASLSIAASGEMDTDTLVGSIFAIGVLAVPILICRNMAFAMHQKRVKPE